MTEFYVLIHAQREDVRIVRLYTIGHDNNLSAWQEEAAERLPDICFNIGDAGNCHLVGEAKWLYLRFTKGNRAVINNKPFGSAIPVTMQRVHRNNTPRKKP